MAGQVDGPKSAWSENFSENQPRKIRGSHPNRGLSFIGQKSSSFSTDLVLFRYDTFNFTFIRSSNNSLGLILMSVNPSKSFTNHPLRDFEELV